MKTYNYPTFIEKEKIHILDGDIEYSPYRWRTLLVLPFVGTDNKEKKIITFVLKNPSLANKKWANKTVYNVICYVNRIKEVDERFQNVNEIRILNLYPIYSTESSKLFNAIGSSNEFDNLQKQNDIEIVKHLKESTFVVPSWGKKPNNLKGRDNQYQKRAKEVLKMLSEVPSIQIFLIKFKDKRTYSLYILNVSVSWETRYTIFFCILTL
ncbi:DUF1643 domain-containing protein [Metabacillus litoralis]|uniref:DUF1643 domain-containing protein n=1 Tax=Metabacillus litoralis TaxID=152268 RepID=UPI00203D3AD5|nr:DUF1643 domain-containing protein [Metabacillus litoralis]MCM3412358.1 DUF1643 domain-containing protein [Metabacillus litoralis]